MADAAAAQAAGAGPAKPLSRRIINLVGIILLCAAALLGGLIASMGMDRAAALLTGGDSPAPAMEAPAPAEEADHGADTAAAGHGADAGHGAAGGKSVVVTPFKEIIVNITATTATGRQTSRFLKLNVALVYDETRPGAANIEDRKLFLRDSFQDYLRQLNEADLRGSIGLVRLKAELLRRARAITGSEAPKEILIADLIIQ
ncbi:MAG: flagellar basal body-associated FliL family protein [Pseudooceanicola sp.]